LAADPASVPPAAPAQPQGPVPQLKPKAEKPASSWVFSLLPKSMQQNPRVAMTVITEMTDAGKRLAPVTPDHPAYFVGQSAGYHVQGDGPDNQKLPPAGLLEALLRKSLAANGYLPAKPPGQPPSLLVVYSWGAHYALHPENDDSISGEMVARNTLERALLIGGQKFATQMQQLFAQEDAVAQAASQPPAPGGQSILGPEQMAMMDPVHLYRLKSPRNDSLVEQMIDDLYYVVASAYDYAAAAHGERRLLWRTRMTVDAKGVALADTLPTLVASASAYFGREMDEPEALYKRTINDGQVEVGTPTVVGTGEEIKK
jgi:hypothetical protein